jgi:fibronectin type 3 domain-containing protein
MKALAVSFVALLLLLCCSAFGQQLQPLSGVVKTIKRRGQPTVHQVGLSWTQSVSPGITGDCVYRGTVTGGPYTQLFCSSTPSTGYTDLSVTAGATYYYVVTALVGSSEESGYSNQFTAIIPNVAPPTGLTGTEQ